MKIRHSTEDDLEIIMNWFPSAAETKIWGGPAITFPFTLNQLKSDLDWEVAKSYSLVLDNNDLIGFCQISEKYGFKHLSRIAIAPQMRGKKLSYKLMTILEQEVIEPEAHLSLFVYEDNIPAIKVYKKMGFNVHPYPNNRKTEKGSVFMVKDNTNT